MDKAKKPFKNCRSRRASLSLGLSASLLAVAITVSQAAPASALFYGTNQQAEAYKHEADAFVESGNYDQAINYYTQAINMLPSDAVQGRADTFYNRAIANDVAGHFDSATQDWTWSRDYYLRAAQYSYGSDAAEYGVNVGYDKQLGDQLGNLVRWRATVNPYSADYEGDAGPIKLWDLRKMPLKVFIDDSQGTGWSPDLRELIWQAVNSWSGIAGIPIRFQTWNSADGAHYIITRPASAGQIAIGSGGYTSGINDTPLANGQQMLAQSKSLLSSPGYDGNSYSQIDKNKLYNLALHECGHALGLGGHSPSGLDIMYWKAPILRLSARDQATMRRMYPSR